MLVATAISQQMTAKHRTHIIWAQCAVVLPHLVHLPVVLSFLAVILLAYLLFKYQFKKQTSRISRFVQLVVVCLGLASILFSYHTIFGVNGGVAFLLLCLLGKLLELHQRRDAYIALTLSLFVVSSLFLFEQSILYTLFALAGIGAVLWAMITQNVNTDYLGPHVDIQPLKDEKSRQSIIRLLFRLMGQAIPLLVVLFIFFPRIPPLWTVPVANNSSITGVSDQMSPGDFANLGQSSELAFRVIDKHNQLEKDLPPANHLYWRGMALSTFDGKTWTPLKHFKIDSTAWPASRNLPDWFRQGFAGNLDVGFEYQVLLQPTQQRWLFALDTPYSSTAQVGVTREFNLKSAQEIYQPFSYDAVELKNIRRDVDLPAWLMHANLQLPQGNPRTRAMAQQVFYQLGSDQEKYIKFWLTWIRQQNFVYTLEPPLLSGNRIDQFLFETRRGFCEHYASAYTVLMRAVGIPARVVVGYQGGAFAPDRQSWEVRQMDAHAWVEVWLPAKGWQRVDPTAAIAPERVERGMNRMMRENQQLFGAGALSQLKYNQMKWLGQVRVWSDYASYVWQRDVVGFDQTSQEGFLKRLLGIDSVYKQIMWMVGLIGSVIALIVGWLCWKRRRIWHPLDAALQRLSAQLGKQQLNRLEQEGMIDWLNRLAVYPEYQQPARQLISIYQRARYSDISQQDEKKLASEISQIVRRWPKVIVKRDLA